MNNVEEFRIWLRGFWSLSTAQDQTAIYPIWQKFHELFPVGCQSATQDREQEPLRDAFESLYASCVKVQGSIVLRPDLWAIPITVEEQLKAAVAKAQKILAAPTADIPNPQQPDTDAQGVRDSLEARIARAFASRKTADIPNPTTGDEVKP